MKILVNQVGYELKPGTGPALCRAIIQSSDENEIPDFIVLRDWEGHFIGEFKVETGQRVTGWKNRVFSIVNFRASEGGPYTLNATSGDTQAASAPFHVGPGIEVNTIISDVLFGISAGRSAGISDNKDRKIPFFGKREGTVDVHGGWYDASGDTSKYLSHLSYANFMNPQQTPLVVWCLIDAYEHLSSGQFPLEERLSLRFREEAAWGADFLVRMQDPDGYFYMTVFDTWSKDLDERRICAYRTQNGLLTEEYQAGYRQGGGATIAALARTASMLKNADSSIGDFNPREYLDAALKGWRHLEKHNQRYLDDGRENIIDDTCALLAAVELYAAGSDGALDKADLEILRKSAEIRIGNLIRRWNQTDGYFRADDEGDWSWFHASDESLPLIALMRSVETGAPGSSVARGALQIVKLALSSEMKKALEEYNPFLHPRHFVRMPGRDNHIQFFYPHDNPSGYWWQGENARLASWSAAVRRYMDIDPAEAGTIEKLAEFGDAQISWILGMNPFNVCMLQGHGKNNPPYEWDHFNVPGGVANGITSGLEDEGDIAFMPAEAAGNGDHSWRWGEQWIPHSAWLLLATAWSAPFGK
jgi:hypothetical protein